MGQWRSGSTPGKSMAAMASGVRRRASASAIVLEDPDPLLGAPSFDVDPLDQDTIETAALLIGAMRSGKWTSLAAPQLGQNVRLICVDVTGHARARSCAGLVLLANPEILRVSGMVVMREACASVKGSVADIARASEVVVSGVVPGTGKPVIVHADALEARCLLHAIDHLDGILFVDRVNDPAADLKPREPPR